MRALASAGLCLVAALSCSIDLHRVASSRTNAPIPIGLHDKLAAAPLGFEPMQGQTGDPVRFAARGSGFGVLLTPHEALLELRPAARPRTAVSIAFAGAKAAPVLEATQKLSGSANYFLGNRPREWRTGVARYGR